MAQLQTILQTQVQQHVYQRAQQRKVISAPVQQHTAQPLSRVEQAEQSLLHIVFYEWNIMQQLRNRNFKFVDEVYQRIFDAWYDFIQQNDSDNFDDNHLIADFLDEVPDDLHDKIAAIESIPWPAANATAQMINDYITTINNHDVHLQLQQIKQQLNDAQRLNNSDKVLQLTSEYIHLMKLMKQK